MRRVKVEVTQEDIKKGVPGESCHCPIALALKRAGVPVGYGKGQVAVGCENLWGQGNRHYPLPEAAIKFILSFDRDHTADPVSFEVDLD